MLSIDRREQEYLKDIPEWKAIKGTLAAIQKELGSLNSSDLPRFAQLTLACKALIEEITKLIDKRTYPTLQKAVLLEQFASACTTVLRLNEIAKSNLSISINDQNVKTNLTKAYQEIYFLLKDLKGPLGFDMDQLLVRGITCRLEVCPPEERYTLAQKAWSIATQTSFSDIQPCDVNHFNEVVKNIYILTIKLMFRHLEDKEIIHVAPYKNNHPLREKFVSDYKRCLNLFDFINNFNNAEMLLLRINLRYRLFIYANSQEEMNKLFDNIADDIRQLKELQTKKQLDIDSGIKFIEIESSYNSLKEMDNRKKREFLLECRETALTFERARYAKELMTAIKLNDADKIRKWTAILSSTPEFILQSTLNVALSTSPYELETLSLHLPKSFFQKVREKLSVQDKKENKIVLELCFLGHFARQNKKGADRFTLASEFAEHITSFYEIGSVGDQIRLTLTKTDESLILSFEDFYACLDKIYTNNMLRKNYFALLGFNYTPPMPSNEPRTTVKPFSHEERKKTLSQMKPQKEKLLQSIKEIKELCDQVTKELNTYEEVKHTLDEKLIQEEMNELPRIRLLAAKKYEDEKRQLETRYKNAEEAKDADAFKEACDEFNETIISLGEIERVKGQLEKDKATLTRMMSKKQRSNFQDEADVLFQSISAPDEKLFDSVISLCDGNLVLIETVTLADEKCSSERNEANAAKEECENKLRELKKIFDECKGLHQNCDKNKFTALQFSIAKYKKALSEVGDVSEGWMKLLNKSNRKLNRLSEGLASRIVTAEPAKQFSTHSVLVELNAGVDPATTAGKNAEPMERLKTKASKHHVYSPNNSDPGEEFLLSIVQSKMTPKQIKENLDREHGHYKKCNFFNFIRIKEKKSAARQARRKKR